MLDADQRGDAAADVHKGPEGFQVGDTGLQHVAGRQFAHKIAEGPALGPGPGEEVLPRPLPDDLKANGLAHPRKHGDLLGGAVFHTKGGFTAGDHPRHAVKIHDQVVRRIA